MTNDGRVNVLRSGAGVCDEVSFLSFCAVLSLCHKLEGGLWTDNISCWISSFGLPQDYDQITQVNLTSHFNPKF